MAHEISVREDGFAECLFADTPAWHGLGTVLDGAFTSEVALEKSGLDWRVELQELKTESGIVVPDMFATVRADSQTVLGVVTDRYQVVQNTEAFSFLDSLVTNGDMKYESCGALQGGKKIWMLARMPSVDIIAEGDICARYLLFTAGHEGKTPIEVLPTSTRVVCANTLRAALGTEVKMSIKHKGDMRSKLDTARKWLSQFDEQFTLFCDHGRKLAERKVKPEQYAEYLDTLFPKPLEIEGRGATIRVNKIQAIRNAFRYERNNLKAIKGTWWQLLNSVTDAIDHATKTTDTRAQQEKRFMSLIDGTDADVKTKAFNLALEMSA
jgi:phage/plasmid-like protein (TIGR03299 family)